MKKALSRGVHCSPFEYAPLCLKAVQAHFPFQAEDDLLSCALAWDAHSKSGGRKKINEVVGSIYWIYMKFLLTAITRPTGIAINSVGTQECSAAGGLFISLNSTASPNPSRVSFISEDLGPTVGIIVTDTHCLCLYRVKSTW